MPFELPHLERLKFPKILHSDLLEALEHTLQKVDLVSIPLLLSLLPVRLHHHFTVLLEDIPHKTSLLHTT